MSRSTNPTAVEAAGCSSEIALLRVAHVRALHAPQTVDGPVYCLECERGESSTLWPCSTAKIVYGHAERQAMAE